MGRIFDATKGTRPALWTFTRASNGRYINSSGVPATASSNVERLSYTEVDPTLRGLLYEPSRTNEYQKSEAPDNTSVQMYRLAGPPSAETDDGVRQWFRLTASADVGGHYWMPNIGTIPNATPFTVSFIVRDINRSSVGIEGWNLPGGDGGFYANFNTPPVHDFERLDVLDTDYGIWGSAYYTIVDRDFEELSPTEWRIWITLTTTVGGGCFGPVLRDHALGNNWGATGDEGLDFAEFQIEVGGEPSSHIPTTTASATRAADAASFKLRSAATALTFTFDDGSTQTISSLTPGATYNVPTTLNRQHIKYIDDNDPAAVHTWNPNDKDTPTTLSNGNLTVTKNTNWEYSHTRSTTSKVSGKWHFEVDMRVMGPDETTTCGLCTKNMPLDGNLDTWVAKDNANTAGVAVWQTDASIWHNNVEVGDLGSAIGEGGTGIVAFEIDFDNEELKVALNNGSWTSAIDISLLIAHGPLYIFAGLFEPSDQQILNTGGSAFTKAMTPGFTSWDGSQYVDIPVTWDPAQKAGPITLSNGNLTATGAATTNYDYDFVRSTTSKDSGKWHVEFALTTMGGDKQTNIGLATANQILDDPGDASHFAAANNVESINLYAAWAELWYNNALVAQVFGGANVIHTDTLAMEVDFDAETVKFARNTGAWSSSYSISALIARGPLFVYGGVVDQNAAEVITANFGGTAFVKTPSSGFTAWQSIPEETLEPIVVTVGLTSETDSAFGVTRKKTRTVGLTTEADSGFGITRVKGKAVGLATETDAALTATVVGGAAPSDPTPGDNYVLAGAFGPSIFDATVDRDVNIGGTFFTIPTPAGGVTVVVGQISETDTALGITRRKSRAVSFPSETDTPLAASRIKLRASGLASEADSGLPASRTKVRSTGLSTSSESLFSITRKMSRVVGLATETETAFQVTSLNAVIIGVTFASEIDTAFSVEKRKSRSVGLISEVDTLFPLTRRRTVSFGVATEADESFGISRRRAMPVGFALETDEAHVATVTTRPVESFNPEAAPVTGSATFGRTLSGKAQFPHRIQA